MLEVWVQVTPPGTTVKLAAKGNAQNKALRTLPGQAVKELMNAYKNITKFQTVYRESGIFMLSNRLETISSLLGKSKETGSIRPLGNFINSNLGITKAINQGGGVRINFNPVMNPPLSAYKAAQNGYES